jgi:hypothetical protein
MMGADGGVRMAGWTMRTIVFSCVGLPSRAAEAAALFNELADPQRCRALSTEHARDLAVLGTVHLLVTMGADDAAERACAHRCHWEWPLLSRAHLPGGDGRAGDLLRRHVCGLIVRAGWDRRVDFGCPPDAVRPPA